MYHPRCFYFFFSSHKSGLLRWCCYAGGEKKTQTWVLPWRRIDWQLLVLFAQTLGYLCFQPSISHRHYGLHVVLVKPHISMLKSNALAACLSDISPLTFLQYCSSHLFSWISSLASSVLKAKIMLAYAHSHTKGLTNAVMWAVVVHRNKVCTFCKLCLIP